MKPSHAMPMDEELGTSSASDAELVEAALAGDRTAFGRLVERHQALVCAITCGGSGDRDRGRDLAQETFLQAWRSLPGLDDATRFRPWLAGIARNVLRNGARRDRTTLAAPLEETGEPASPGPLPHDEVVAREEQAMLWHALAELPASYREVLLLFYWKDHSVAGVAEVLGLGEDAVRQRLARGRRMLRAEIEAVVEAGLRRTRPGKAFTVAVVAALPAGVPEAAVAAGSMTSAAAKVVLGAGMTGALVGSTVGLLGGFLGARASIKNTRSARERGFMVRTSLLFAALSLGFVGLQLAVALLWPAAFRSVWWHLPVATAYSGGLCWAIVRVNRRQHEIQIEDGTHVSTGPTSPRERRFLIFAGVVSVACVAAFLVAEAVFERYFPDVARSLWGQLTRWSLYLVGLMQGVSWINRKQHAIRVAEGRAVEPPPPPPDAPTREIGASPRVIYSSLAGGVFGGTLWMYPMCWMAGDWLIALLILAVSAVTLQVSARHAIRHPERYFRIAFWEGLVTGALVLGVVNLRYEAWMVFYRQSRWYEPTGDWPLWLVNLALVTMFAWLELGMLRRDRRHRPGS